MSDKEAVIRFREYNFDQDPKWKELVENLSIFDEPGSYAYENKLYRQKKKYYHSKVEPILSILGDDDYKQHVTYKKGEENSQTNTDDAPPQNNPSTESSPPSQTQQIQGGVVHKYFRRFYKSLTTATLLNLSAFTSSILSVLLMLFSTGLSRSFYYLSLFSLAFLYLGTYFANKGFSLESLKLLCSDVFGLYAAIILTFLTTPQSITFSLLITLWAFSPLPSLVQRFMNRNNIQNANIQSLVNKAATYSPAVPMAAAKLELYLLLEQVMGLFSSNRQFVRLFAVFFYLSSRYPLSPPLRNQIYSIRLALDQLTNHPNCPQIIRNVYQRAKISLGG